MDFLDARRILIPVDFSRASRNAWAWAGELFDLDVRKEVFFVAERPSIPAFDLPAPALTGVNRRKVAARLHTLYPGSKPRVLEGDPSALVVREARKADLVIMGSHGRRGLERAVLGSVCETVMRDSPAPVLAVKDGPRPIESVLAPVNLAPYSRKGLSLAARAAAGLGATLTVLYVVSDKGRGPNPKFFLNGMLALLPERLRKAVKPRLLVREGDPVREILAESRKHGLIVLAAHRKSLLSELVLGTTVERVLRHSSVPVLAAPSGR